MVIADLHNVQALLKVAAYHLIFHAVRYFLKLLHAVAMDVMMELVQYVAQEAVLVLQELHAVATGAMLRPAQCAVHKVVHVLQELHAVELFAVARKNIATRTLNVGKNLLPILQRLLQNCQLLQELREELQCLHLLQL